MFIRLTDIEKDRSSIIEIWRACFSDDLAYIDSFINYCLPYTKSWTLLHNDKPVSLLSLIPSYIPFSMYCPSPDRESSSNESKTFFPSKRESLHGAYIYGVATLPEHRGSSYSRLLADKAVEYSVENRLDYIVVKPAEESLFSLYSKMGFETTLFCHRASFELSKDGEKKYSLPSNFSPLSEERLYSLREGGELNTFLWPKEILGYTLREVLSRPGAVTLTDGEIYFISAPSYSSLSNIEILETNAKTKEQVEQIVSFIQKGAPQAQSISICTNAPNNSAILDIFGKLKKERSALLKILNPDAEIKRYLSERYLSLPME